MSSSSSDSDVDVPKLKKKKSKTKRGLGSLLKNTEATTSAFSENSDYLYTTNIYTAGKKTLSKDIQEEILLCAELDQEETEADFHSLFIPKKAKTTNNNQKSSCSKSWRNSKSDEADNQSSNLNSSNEPEIVLLDSEDDKSEVKSNPADSSYDRGSQSSPTPPPSPNTPNLVHKKKRKKKGVTKAINALSKASAKFKQSVDNDCQGKQDEADVSIVDVVTSPSPTKCNILTVKVKSRSGIQRYPMTLNQPFSTIIRDTAAHEFVKMEQVMLYLNDERLQTYDTPSSANLGVADIIECHIRKVEDLTKLNDDILYPEDDPDVISLRVQGKNPKSRVTIRMRKHETMERLMRVYAERMKVDNMKRLEFSFDGEEICSQDTAQGLDLEDDFCIDVAGL